MPAHSLEYTKHQWKFDEYAEAIWEIRDAFSEVVVCIHPSCIRHGYWVDSFRSRGFTIVEGAYADDRNSLERLQRLLSTFEFVTTNAYGSCIAYASALGAKVSVFGPFADIELLDLSRDPFYRQRPGLAAKIVELNREGSVRATLGEFFTHPAEAPSRIEWGQFQIGKDNIVSPAEMRRLFKWDRLSSGRKRFLGTLKDGIDRSRSIVKRIAKPIVARLETEIARLRQLPPAQAGFSVLAGREFYFSDAGSFLDEYDRVFWKSLYDFPAIIADPRIVDCNSGAGVAIRSWIEKFSSPRIVAIESDPLAFSALQKNLARYPNVEVELHNARLIANHTTVDEQPNLDTDSISLLDLLKEPADYLRIRIESNALDVLTACGIALRKIKNIYIEYIAIPEAAQRLETLLAVLTSNGFRYHLSCQANAFRPLFGIELHEGCEQRINVWAWQDD